jgi:hypothetical protein
MHIVRNFNDPPIELILIIRCSNYPPQEHLDTARQITTIVIEALGSSLKMIKIR